MAAAYSLWLSIRGYTLKEEYILHMHELETKQKRMIYWTICKNYLYS